MKILLIIQKSVVYIKSQEIHEVEKIIL
jgi:hypothetical protein